MTSHNRKSDKAIFMERVQSEIKNAAMHFTAGVSWDTLSSGQRESINAGHAALNRCRVMLSNEAKPKPKKVANARPV